MSDPGSNLIIQAPLCPPLLPQAPSSERPNPQGMRHKNLQVLQKILALASPAPPSRACAFLTGKKKKQLPGTSILGFWGQGVRNSVKKAIMYSFSDFFFNSILIEEYAGIIVNSTGHSPGHFYRPV